MYYRFLLLKIMFSTRLSLVWLWWGLVQPIGAKNFTFGQAFKLKIETSLISSSYA